MASILVVDDDADILFAAKMFLKKHVEVVFTESNPKKIPSILQDHSIDIVLLDMNFTSDTTSGKEGFSWLKTIKEYNASIVVILITAFGDVSMAVDAIKNGASDFVLKPWSNEKLLATINSAIELSRAKENIETLREENKYMREEINSNITSILGTSEAMQHVFDTIEKVAGSDANVLITGENGTGKELVAREIHRLSKRNDKIFVSVDLGALSDNLFESELFGHVKGAFTGANVSKKGRFELANGGTIFLDEIGNISEDKQIKLLTVLQSREVQAIGSSERIKLDLRVISATNVNIEELSQNALFREDLLYRLNTIEIHLPALRKRGADINLLANHFLQKFSAKYNKSESSLSEAAIEAINVHQWKGNVRELEHTMERAVLLSESSTITEIDLALKSQSRDSTEMIIPNDELNIEEMERKYIEIAIKKNQGNLSKAAKELGLTRQALYRRLEKYDL